MIPQGATWRCLTLDAWYDLQLDFEGEAFHLQQMPFPRLSMRCRSLRGVGLLGLPRHHSNRHTNYHDDGSSTTTVSMSDPDDCSSLQSCDCTCGACEWCLDSAGRMPEQWMASRRVSIYEEDYSSEYYKWWGGLDTAIARRTVYEDRVAAIFTATKAAAGELCLWRTSAVPARPDAGTSTSKMHVW